MAQERVPTSEKDNVMYLNHADYYFETLKFDSDEPAGYGELGRIVITDLHNYAFPIIRYDTGDVGMLLPPDKFSHGYPVLGKLFGRRMDLCFTTDGNVFSPMAIGRIMKHYDFVSQWQFIQKEEKRYCLKLIYEKENVAMADLLHSLKEVVGQDAKIDIVKVDEIPVLASGKRKPVVNEWKRT